MTATQIISEVYKSPDLDSCIRTRKRPRWFPGNLQDWQNELKAETFKIICEQPSELIEKIWREGKINFFVGRIIINLSRQERNSLQKPYMKVGTMQPDGLPIAEDVVSIDEDYSEAKGHLEAMKQSNHTGYYYANLIELYGKHGSLRAVSAQTKIPVMSVRQAIIRGRKLIKQMIDAN